MPISHLKKADSGVWRDYKNPRPTKRTKPNKRKSLLQKLIMAGLLLGSILIILGVIFAFWVSRDLPNPNQLIKREVAQSTKIYDRSGENILYEISGEQKRTLVTLNDIPDKVEQATIAIEDKNFYKHGGFSLWAMFRTAVTNVLFNRSAGGSTLTQQFIKNAVLTSEKTITRKIKELILSYRLEKKFSKDEILQMYLNEIPYGSNAYGVEAASQKYFGKSVKEVSLAEAAILAAIVQVPSRYSPYGPNKDILLSRKDYVLNLMAEQGYISAAERDAAQAQEIKFKAPGDNITAPHFVMYIKALLADKYGEKTVEQGGLKIYTTLDLYKQKAAEETIDELTKEYPKKYGANNAALVAIDPKTGQILAMVGSRDYFDDTIDGQVNVATRPRQPGSSMKPLVYAALFEKGYTPDTLLYDVNTNFSTDPANPYTPHNYDLKEHGPVTIRQALAGSLNLPAVKAIYLADINNVIDLAENLGYTTLYPRSRFGLSLVLGGGEVKLLEHVNAYGAFARDGQISPVVNILKVEDKDGRIMEEYKPASKKALNSQVARMINSILTDNEARSFIFGSKNFLTLGNRPVGAKTGTTNDYHDAWTIGYTPSLVTGVWVGNSDNKAMSRGADGSVVAAPIWHAFMLKVLGDTPIEAFKAPDDYKTGKPILDGQILTETVRIEKASGFIAASSTPDDLVEEKIVPAYHSILYYVNKDNPTGPAPENPAQDPQFNLWEKAVQDWASKNASSSAALLLVKPAENTRPEDAPIITIISPEKNSAINTAFLNIQIEALAKNKAEIEKTEYYINGNLWEIKTGAPDAFTGNINFLNNGYHVLKARSCDNLKNCGENSVDFNVLIKNNPITAGKNSIKIITPSSGLALNKIDFPLGINLAVSRPERVAQITLISRNSSGELKNIKSLNEGLSSNLTINWTDTPVTGNYSLYAELRDWNGDIINSNEINISIN